MEETVEKGEEKHHWSQKMEEMKHKIEDKLHLHGSHGGGLREMLKETFNGPADSGDKKKKNDEEEEKEENN